MAKVKYETADILPMVIMVLTYTMSDFIMSAYKVALDNQFIDLAEMVDSEEMDQQVIDLVQGLDDPLSLLVQEVVDSISDYNNHICMLHGIDHPELCINERIRDLAGEFYAALSLYCPGNYRSKGNLGDLYCFTFCVDHIIYRLCETMIIEKRTFPMVVYKRWRSMKKVNFADFNKCDLYEVRLLVNLGLRLDDLCDRIVDIAGKGRHKRPGHVSRLVKTK